MYAIYSLELRKKRFPLNLRRINVCLCIVSANADNKNESLTNGYDGNRCLLEFKRMVTHFSEFLLDICSLVVHEHIENPVQYFP